MQVIHQRAFAPAKAAKVIAAANVGGGWVLRHFAQILSIWGEDLGRENLRHIVDVAVELADEEFRELAEGGFPLPALPEPHGEGWMFGGGRTFVRIAPAKGGNLLVSVGWFNQPGPEGKNHPRFAAFRAATEE